MAEISIPGVYVVDAAANDSDKTFTVPAAMQYVPLSAYVNLATTATAGNRQVEIRFTDGSDNVLGKVLAGATQAASLTREYTFAPQLPNDTAFTGAVMTRALPYPLILPAGYKIRILDNAAVDAAADDMTVRLLVEARAG